MYLSCTVGSQNTTLLFRDSPSQACPYWLSHPARQDPCCRLGLRGLVRVENIEAHEVVLESRPLPWTR